MDGDAKSYAYAILMVDKEIKAESFCEDFCLLLAFSD